MGLRLDVLKHEILTQTWRSQTLQVYWKFVAFPYISYNKVTIYNAHGPSTDGKINSRPEKHHWLFITKDC